MVPPTGILTRLKVETRPQHDAIERALALVDPALTRSRYRARLEQLYGFYEPVEACLREVGGWAERGVDLAARRKAPLLRGDLEALDGGRAGDLATCRALPPLDTAAASFGCLYVLEGSTLGGQFIARHIRATLGVTPESGGRFFQGYGAQTGAMWQSFRDALEAFATAGGSSDEVVAGAVETFRSLHRWCEGE